MRDRLATLIATGLLLRAQAATIGDPVRLLEFKLRHREWILNGVQLLDCEFEHECVTEFVSLKLPPLTTSKLPAAARTAEQVTRNAVEYLGGLLATLERNDQGDRPSRATVRRSGALTGGLADAQSQP